MKSLKQILEASLLDIDSNLEVTDEEVTKSVITQFINDNYYTREFTISDEPNKDGKYEVSSKYGVAVKNINITSLTNYLFVWNIVKGNFNCDFLGSLQSLEGSPKEVKGNFDCSLCDSLQSLEGSPKEVKGNFDCTECSSLTSLEGAPNNVGGSFYCNNCKSLTTLKYAPKKVKGNFYCLGCKFKFEESDVKAVSKVLTLIYV